VEVHHSFKLMPETLFLTIDLVDRFLSNDVVNRKHLQVCHFFISFRLQLLPNLFHATPSPPEFPANSSTIRIELLIYLTPLAFSSFSDVIVVFVPLSQLVGVTAMLLASKYEENWAPERALRVRDCVDITDKSYSHDQVLGMEKEILNALDFHLTVPTPYEFMSRFCEAANADKQFQHLASFMLESALIDYSMLRYPGSLLAASAAGSFTCPLLTST
jgi:hypothetical protein